MFTICLFDYHKNDVHQFDVRCEVSREIIVDEQRVFMRFPICRFETHHKRSNVHNFSRIIVKYSKGIYCPNILGKLSYGGSASLRIRVWWNI